MCICKVICCRNYVRVNSADSESSQKLVLVVKILIVHAILLIMNVKFLRHVIVLIRLLSKTSTQPVHLETSAHYSVTET